MKLRLPHTLAARHVEGPWETGGGAPWEWSTAERCATFRGSAPLVTTVTSCSMKQRQGWGFYSLTCCAPQVCAPAVGTWVRYAPFK